MPARTHGWQSPEVMVKRLVRTMVEWAHYFSVGHVSSAYTAVTDAVLDEELTMPQRPAPLVTMNDLFESSLRRSS